MLSPKQSPLIAWIELYKSRLLAILYTIIYILLVIIFHTAMPWSLIFDAIGGLETWFLAAFIPLVVVSVSYFVALCLHYLLDHCPYLALSFKKALIRTALPLTADELKAVGIQTQRDCHLFLAVFTACGYKTLFTKDWHYSEVLMNEDCEWIAALMKQFAGDALEFSWEREWFVSARWENCTPPIVGPFSASAISFCRDWAIEHKAWEQIGASFEHAIDPKNENNKGGKPHETD